MDQRIFDIGIDLEQTGKTRKVRLVLVKISDRGKPERKIR